MTDVIPLREEATDFDQLDARTMANVQRGLRIIKERDPVIALDEVPSLLIDSEPMADMFAMMKRVAPTRASVLIIGETGTGKEVIAQNIHQLSKLAEKPFIAVNCGAIPASLIEAELFGHERGSFTGAIRNHKGVFERAAGGTLFLDEVTEMPPEMQVKLLRALETGRFYRVGGDEEIRSTCRILAATNRNPDQAVGDGVLRADLLYRLAVFPLRVPSLRARGKDIELLANKFVDDLNAESGDHKSLSASARKYLYEHNWPGNVRELKNAIYQAHILADTEINLRALKPPRQVPQCDRDQIAVRIGTPIAAMERELIAATLERCEGNKRQAAKLLGVSLKTLYNRLNDYARFTRTSGHPEPSFSAGRYTGAPSVPAWAGA